MVLDSTKIYCAIFLCNLPTNDVEALNSRAKLIKHPNFTPHKRKLSIRRHEVCNINIVFDSCIKSLAEATSFSSRSLKKNKVYLVEEEVLVCLNDHQILWKAKAAARTRTDFLVSIHYFIFIDSEKAKLKT